MTTDNAEALPDVGPLYDALDRNLWAGANILRGELPTWPIVSALPAASAAFRGKTALVLGDGTHADVVSVCLKSSSNTYSWKAIATG